MSTKDQGRITAGLVAQGAEVRSTKTFSLVVHYNGKLTVINTRVSDYRGLANCRANIRRLGLEWPLDPTFTPPKSPRPEPVSEVLEVSVAPKPAPPRKEPEMPPQQNDPNHEIVSVTPTLAAQWLDTMAQNRKLSAPLASRLASQMNSGLWVYDGSPIRFNVKGELVDGQHRLWAVIEHDGPIDFLVVRNVAEEAMATMDTGKARSFADVLQIENKNLTHTNSVAALIPIVYRWESGERGSAAVGYGTRGVGGNKKAAANAELLAFFDANQLRIVEAAQVGARISSRIKGMSASVLALGFWIFNEIESDDASFFFDRLADGAGLDEGSPILLLRNHMIRASQQPQPPRVIAPGMALPLMIKAWNAYRRGVAIRILGYKTGGSSPESFPTAL
jgi:hypothetical protein